MTVNETFLTCSMCKAVWKTREDFLTDPAIRLAGYQAYFEQLTLGLFLFNHLVCGTTLSIHAERFKDLYTGPIFDHRATGTEECPGHCLNQKNLDPCPVRCECAYIREILQMVRHIEEHKAPAA